MSPTFTALTMKLADALTAQQLKLTTAESCTGGGLSFYLTQLPGSSAWFERGFVTYSNAAKQDMLGVAATTLLRFGAVSEQTARAMATGALSHSLADISIAITGIAGPDGGTAEKPVGTVWLAVAKRDGSSAAIVNCFAGNREKIRHQAIERALECVLKMLYK